MEPFKPTIKRCKNCNIPMRTKIVRHSEGSFSIRLIHELVCPRCQARVTNKREQHERD